MLKNKEKLEDANITNDKTKITDEIMDFENVKEEGADGISTEFKL
tara:strand:- start:114 stop:248 length:135 start_codon:yes stop_codon:yes gene_type:complete